MDICPSLRIWRGYLQVSLKNSHDIKDIIKDIFHIELLLYILFVGYLWVSLRKQHGIKAIFHTNCYFGLFLGYLQISVSDSHDLKNIIKYTFQIKILL